MSDRQPIFKKRSILSKERWHACEAWRKRSCYEYISRKILGRPNLQNWNDFCWEDYIERNQFIRTFNKRHLPVTNGTSVLPQSALPDLPSWANVRAGTGRKKQQRKSKPVTRQRPAKKASSALSATPNKLMWDYSKEMWVRNTMGTLSPADVAVTRHKKDAGKTSASKKTRRRLHTSPKVKTKKKKTKSKK